MRICLSTSWNGAGYGPAWFFKEVPKAIAGRSAVIASIPVAWYLTTVITALHSGIVPILINDAATRASAGPILRNPWWFLKFRGLAHFLLLVLTEHVKSPRKHSRYDKYPVSPVFWLKRNSLLILSNAKNLIWNEKMKNFTITLLLILSSTTNQALTWLLVCTPPMRIFSLLLYPVATRPRYLATFCGIQITNESGIRVKYEYNISLIF